LVKQRAYGSVGATGQASAQAALQVALSVLLRLFAPVMPFVTEEVWSWWQTGSVHAAAWPEASEFAELAHIADADPAVLDIAASVLSEVRRAKTEAKRSLRTDVDLAVVSASDTQLAALGAARSDVTDAGAIIELRTVALDGALDGGPTELSVEVHLAPEAEPETAAAPAPE
jgi:valyl-tRNA synthetase